MTTFPDLILDSNETYVLYTKRADKSSVDGSQLIGVSLIYVDHDLTTHEETLDKDKTYELKTSNYPNYYSVGSDHLWRIGSTVNETVGLLSIKDIDLSPGHELSVWSKNQKTDINATNLSDLSDILIKFPLFMNLTSDSIDISKQPFSGRGFTANLTTFVCGDNYTVDSTKPLVINTPQNLTGISKCIWTVTTKNPNDTTISLLEFTVNDSDDKELIKKLRVWDSNSIRDNKFLNFSYFNTSLKSSSTNSLIIEYSIDTKKPMALNLTFKPTGISSIFYFN